MIKTIVFNTFIHSIPFVFGEKERVRAKPNHEFTDSTNNNPFFPIFQKGYFIRK